MDPSNLTPCPDWCEDEPGHPFNADEIGEGRFHTRTLLDNNLATVRLVVIEAVMLTDDGVLHAFDVPQLDVDVDDSLELGDAERLITALIDGIRFGRQLLRDAA